MDINELYISYTMSSDTLVLKIEERESHSGQVDTTVYLFYDHDEQAYHVRGCRSRTRNVVYEPYSFRCAKSTDLTFFLRHAMCKKNAWNYTLYNMSDLASTSDEIVFDDLHWNQSVTKEICGYDDQGHNRKTLNMILRMLRNMYNHY